MKKKISITLSRDLRAAIDRLVAPNDSRSAFIERALTDHFERAHKLQILSVEAHPGNTQASHE